MGCHLRLPEPQLSFLSLDAMPSALTKKQRSLVSELTQICDLLEINFQCIEDFHPRSRTTRLLVMRNKLIRGQVIVWYTPVDEFLTNRICRFFFGKKRSFIYLWRTKRFKLFNYHVLGQLSLLPKLRLGKAIRPIPKAIAADIEHLNALRNGLAHAFFPENLRSAKPVWKGKDVFTIDGLRRLEADLQNVFAHFVRDEKWY
jgi:hypothetical protein